MSSMNEIKNMLCVMAYATLNHPLFIFIVIFRISNLENKHSIIAVQ